MAAYDSIAQARADTEHRSGRERRQCSLLRTPWYWGLWGRRRTIRRTSDRQHMHVDHYPAYLLVVVIGIFLLAQADTILTLQMLKTGNFFELNPLMQALLDRDVHYFITVRSFLWGLALIMLVAVARYPRIWRIRPRRVIGSIAVVYALVTASMFSMLLAWEW